MMPPISPPQNTKPPRLHSVVMSPREDHVVDLRAEQPADHGGEHEIADRLGIVSAALELALRDDLRDREREQHRDPEAGEGEDAELVRKWMMNGHAGREPGMGSEATAESAEDARSPDSKRKSPARAIIAALSVASRADGA